MKIITKSLLNGILLAFAIQCLSATQLPNRNAFYHDEGAEGVVERYFKHSQLCLEAMAAFKRGEHATALELYARADLLSPNDGLLWHFVAKIHIASDDTSRAKEVAYHILECHFGMDGWRRYPYSARILMDIGAHEEAMAVLEAGKIIYYAKGDIHTYARLLRSRARFLAESGSVEEAIAQLSEGARNVANWDLKQEVLDLFSRPSAVGREQLSDAEAGVDE